MHSPELENALKPQPLKVTAKWPYEPTSACTGSCNQGRACDCCPDADDMDDPPMTRTEARWMAVVYVTCAAAVVSGIAYLIR